MNKDLQKDLRNKISKILVKHNMPTRQIAISELAQLITEPLAQSSPPQEEKECLFKARRSKYISENKRQNSGRKSN